MNEERSRNDQVILRSIREHDIEIKYLRLTEQTSNENNSATYVWKKRKIYIVANKEKLKFNRTSLNKRNNFKRHAHEHHQSYISTTTKLASH